MIPSLKACVAVDRHLARFGVRQGGRKADQDGGPILPSKPEVVETTSRLVGGSVASGWFGSLRH